MFFAIYFKTNIQIFFVLAYFVRHTPQFKMLVFASQSEGWIAENFNFTVFEDFVYHCHGNIDFYKMQTTLKFDPKPTSIENFTLI